MQRRVVSRPRACVDGSSTQRFLRSRKKKRGSAAGARTSGGRTASLNRTPRGIKRHSTENNVEAKTFKLTEKEAQTQTLQDDLRYCRQTYCRYWRQTALHADARTPSPRSTSDAAHPSCDSLSSSRRFVLDASNIRLVFENPACSATFL